MEAPTEADLRHHHDVALAPNLEAGGLQPDPHCDSNSSHLSGWCLSRGDDLGQQFVAGWLPGGCLSPAGVILEADWLDSLVH